MKPVNPLPDELETSSRRILCLMPGEPGSDTAAAFSAAVEGAGPQDAVVIYDRSRESWRPDDDVELRPGDDPALSDLDGLVAAREQARAAGVDLLVWRSITPTIGTGIVDAIQHARITDIVLPDEGANETAGDTVLGDDSSLAAAVRSLLAKPLVTGAGLEPELHLVSSS